MISWFQSLLFQTQLVPLHCGAEKSKFKNMGKQVAGFEQNQGYGLGTNSMTGVGLYKLTHLKANFETS